MTNDNTFATLVIIMIRTQISLSENDYQKAKAEAQKLGISLAEFFRKALKAALPVKTEKPWMKYCGMVTSGDPNSSQKVDDLIYGLKD